MPYDYDPTDAHLYSPEQVDKLDVGDKKWVRLEEYTKVWREMEVEKSVSHDLMEKLLGSLE